MAGARTALADTQLVLFWKGEFYNRKNHSEPPFAAQDFTLALQPGYMLSLGLSEFTLNSATYGYFSAGLLQILVNDSMVSPLLGEGMLDIKRWDSLSGIH